MRVALVILHADPKRGGAERYTVDLASALAGHGTAVSLISSSPGPEIPGVESVVLRSDGLTRTGRYWRWLHQLDQHLAARAYDIVHAALPVRRCDVYHPHAGMAVEAVRHGHFKRTGWARWLSFAGNRLNGRRLAFAAVERQLLTGPRPPIVISLSRYVQTSIEQSYSLPPDRHACLFNAVDLDRFDPAKSHAAGRAWRVQLGCAQSDVLALMIAQDFERKGLREALAAMACVRDPRIKLVIVGKPDPSSWRREAVAAGIAHRVIFAGPTTQPAACYSGADVFILPTKHDPCSLVVLEALAMGLPVITTNRNGAAEVMTQGREGLVLSNPDDVAALTTAIDDLSDDEVRERMAQACLQLRPRLSYDQHVATLLDIYRRTSVCARAA